LSRQDYLIPMVAASFQYPIHYYGMTSAALLEDLFVDASINFRNSHKREIEISRPERESSGEEANSKGVKGWDYQFQGEHFSHKVGKGINSIALLWDATVELPENKLWSYESTMVFVLSNYKKSLGILKLQDREEFSISPISMFRNKQVSEGHLILICERLSNDDWKIHECLITSNGDNLAEIFPLEEVWEKMIGYWAKGSANRFDIFISTKKIVISPIDLIGHTVKINFEVHPGVYIFEKENLKNIEVTQNNRAVLLPAKKVQELARQAAENKLFVFMPSWYMAYAENRPADLYLAQKQEFDQMNSASRRR